MENLNVTLPMSECGNKEVVTEMQEQFEHIFDFYKGFIISERLDESDLIHMLNELLINYLINDKAAGIADKRLMKDLIDCCLVMVQHFEKIVRIQKKHSIFDDDALFARKDH
jgi:hypothetical protein